MHAQMDDLFASLQIPPVPQDYGQTNPPFGLQLQRVLQRRHHPTLTTETPHSPALNGNGLRRSTPAGPPYTTTNAAEIADKLVQLPAGHPGYLLLNNSPDANYYSSPQSAQE